MRSCILAVRHGLCVMARLHRRGCVRPELAIDRMVGRATRVGSDGPRRENRNVSACWKDGCMSFGVVLEFGVCMAGY